MFIENKITGPLTNQVLLTYVYLKVLAEKVNLTDTLKISQILNFVLDKNLSIFSVSTVFKSFAGDIFEEFNGPESFQLHLHKTPSLINYYFSNRV